MKKILLNVVALALSTSVIFGCSTNTTSQNTGIGVVSGAAIGGVAGGLIASNPAGVAIGAITGAVLGGVIGHSMDSTDKVQMNTAMNGDRNHSTTWVNTKTGQRYTVIPTSGWMTINGNPHCRTFKTISKYQGKKHVSHGTACLDKNGVWHDVM